MYYLSLRLFLNNFVITFSKYIYFAPMTYALCNASESVEADDIFALRHVFILHEIEKAWLQKLYVVWQRVFATFRTNLDYLFIFFKSKRLWYF